jgi:hypothetical protein
MKKLLHSPVSPPLVQVEPIRKRKKALVGKYPIEERERE